MHQGYNRYNKGEKNEVLVAFLKKAPQKTFDTFTRDVSTSSGGKLTKVLRSLPPDDRAKRGLNRAEARKVPAVRSTVGKAPEGAQLMLKKRLLT